MHNSHKNCSQKFLNDFLNKIVKFQDQSIIFILAIELDAINLSNYHLFIKNDNKIESNLSSSE